MKQVINIMLFFLSSSTLCIAQDEEITKKADSLSYISRAKADLVLANFDSITTEKMLYSISDEEYYVILKDDGCYKEFYIQTDSVGNVVEQRLIKAARQNMRILERAFNVKNYQEGFIKRIANATVVEGKPSYFVFKDVEGKRYGEYSLSVLTSPIPIDKRLYSYLLTRLLNESARKKAR